MIELIKKKGVNPQTKEVIYYAKWTRHETVDKEELSEIMARTSTFSVGEVGGLIVDFSQQICDQLLAGNAVNVQGLGTFKLRVSCKAQTVKDDVTSQGAKVDVLFDPDVKLTKRLNADSKFKFVVKPTAEGKKDADADDDAPVLGGDEGPGGEQIGG